MEYLSLGKIIDSYGVDGTVKIFSSTNNAIKRYQKGNKVFLFNEKNNQREEVSVVSYRCQGNIDLVQFLQITTPEKAKEYKGYQVQVIKDRKDLKEGYYFYDDLRGCLIVDENNKQYGIVKEIEEFPAQITLRVARQNEKDFFVPFIQQFIIDVDINKKKITIRMMDGLL